MTLDLRLFFTFIPIFAIVTASITVYFALSLALAVIGIFRLLLAQ